MSDKEFLERELGMGPEVVAYADLFLASAGGLGSDATSVFAAYNLLIAGLMDYPHVAERWRLLGRCG